MQISNKNKSPNKTLKKTIKYMGKNKNGLERLIWLTPELPRFKILINKFNSIHRYMPLSKQLKINKNIG